MGRPLNSKLFGANQLNNLKCRFYNGTDSVRGYIVKQLGARTFLCEDEYGVQAICKMVVKAAADVGPGEMTFTLRFDDGSKWQATKITQNLVTGYPMDSSNYVGGSQLSWSFNSSNSDSILQMDEAGYDPTMGGATDLEGVDLPSIAAWLTWQPRGNLRLPGVNFGWTSDTIWFSGDASGEGDPLPSYPIFTNFTISDRSVVEVSYSFPYTNCNDISVAVYRDADSPPNWEWGSDPTRIAGDYNCGVPEINGLSSGVEGYDLLSGGDTYWSYFKYDPAFRHAWHDHSANVTISSDGIATADWPIDNAAIVQANIPLNFGNNISIYSMVSVTFGNIVGSNSTAIGLMWTGDTMDGELGNQIPNSIAWQASGGVFGFAGSPSDGPQFKSGDTVDIAMDNNYYKAWIRVNGSDWYGGLGSGLGDPTAGAGDGFDTSMLTGERIYLAAQLFNDGTADSITINTSNTYPMPDGYSFVGATGKVNFDTRADYNGEASNLLNELVLYDKLLPGNYRVGFSADQDNTNDRATLYNLEVTVDHNTLCVIQDDEPTLLKTPFFYNVFGNITLGPQQDGIIVGSVVHDTGGNIYMVGQHYNNGIAENLYLKYNETGDLQWRKTWTDSDNFSCGSYNQSLRIDHSNSDMMYWCSDSVFYNKSYVGHMDTDGNLIRNPIELDGYYISDIELAGGTNVIIAGNSQSFPFAPTIAKLDVTTGIIEWSANVVPSGSSLGDGPSTFHSIMTDPAFEIVTLGTYPHNADGNTSAMFSHFGNEGYNYKMYRIGGNTEADAQTWAAASVSYEGNAYVMVNEQWSGGGTTYTTVVTKLEYIAGGSQNEGTWSTVWQKRLGSPSQSGCVQIIGTSLTVSNGNVYASGTLVSGPYPVVSLSQMDESTGTVEWTRLMGVQEYTTGTFPLSNGLGPLITGTSDISVNNDRIAFGSYIGFHGSDSSSAALMLQYPTDGNVYGQFGPTFIVDSGIIYNTSVDIGLDLLSGSYDQPTISTSVASLLATTRTETIGFDEFHWDLTNNRPITQ